MAVYDQFAKYYFKGPYRQYSQHILSSFPALQERYRLPESGSLLDLACGTGDYAVGMATKGWQVSGLDQSAQMLELARQNAQHAGQTVNWIHCDMRDFDLSHLVDMVTCWYDSLNYLLTPEDLTKAFSQVSKTLKPDGYFLFDMNTVYNLAVGWQQQQTYIQHDMEDLLEIHRATYDGSTQIAILHITGFSRIGEFWERMDETHRERGYPIEEIISSIENAGLYVIEFFSSLKDFSKPTPESKRVWFIAQRQGNDYTINGI